MHEQYPFKNSPQSLTLETEIKRTAKERGETIDRTIEILSDLSGVSVRQIYNYRNGVTDIPSGLIPCFCKQFGSNALAMSILNQCGESDEIENFDLVKLANQSAQAMLGAHQHFLAAVEDGVIDGFEFNESKRRTANVVSMAHRLDQVIEDAYKRRHAA